MHNGRRINRDNFLEPVTAQSLTHSTATREAKNRDRRIIWPIILVYLGAVSKGLETDSPMTCADLSLMYAPVSTGDLSGKVLRRSLAGKYGTVQLVVGTPREERDATQTVPYMAFHRCRCV